MSFCSGVRDEEFGHMATAGVLGGDQIPPLGFASVRPPAILYSMVTLLDIRLSCRGAKFSFLTRDEALEVGLKSPQMRRTDLLSTISSLSCRFF